MSRPSKDEYFVVMAKLVAMRSTCLRRSVGCVFVDAKGRVLSTGYNGVPSGVPHCNEGVPCAGASAPSGESLDKCMAIHAEMNAVCQCPDIDKVETIYTTTSPCIACTKVLLNTGAKRVVFIEEYVHPEAKDLWLSTGRLWEKTQYGL